MARKRKGKASRNAKKTAAADVEEELKKLPHSLVFHRGNVGRNVSELVLDMRRVMEPFTGTNLKVRRNNSLKDFVNIAGPLNISHFLTFTKTKLANYMRVMRLPHGPTLTFKINNYSLSRDIVSSLKRHHMDQKQFQSHPLLVMNNFSGHGMHLKLMTTMFQNLFPSINVNKVKLSKIRRCVLLSYKPEANTLEFRHYNIKVVPVGMSKGVKKLVKAQVPDMGRLEDISEYMLRAGDMSESEAELDGDHNEVVLPQKMTSRGNIKAAKSALRLTEVGPRLTLKLHRIEEGLCDGEVLFHRNIEKTDDEKKLLASKRQSKKKLKEKRKKAQQENVKKKQQQKETNKQKSLDGMKKANPGDDGNEAEESQISGQFGADESDDDIDYYRSEVGEEPEPELFPRKSKVTGYKRKSSQPSSKGPMIKRHKLSDKTNGDDSRNKKPKQKKPLTDMDKIKRRKLRKKTQKLKNVPRNAKHSGKTKIKSAHPRKK